MIMRRPVQPGRFAMRQQQEAVHRIAIQRPAGRLRLMQCRQPGLRLRGLRQGFQMVAAFGDQGRAERPPDGPDAVDEMLQAGPGHRLSLRLRPGWRSEEHTSELQSLMRISYAVFCLKKKNKIKLSTSH